jgi:hypothetical protein
MPAMLLPQPCGSRPYVGAGYAGDALDANFKLKRNKDTA